VCGNPLAFQSWAKAAAAHATFISMRGDLKCEKRKRRYKWSYNFKGLDQRIDRVIAAANELRGDDAKPLDESEVVLIGYSQGAHRVETMAHRYPKRYPRVVIIAPAREPDPFKLRKSERILLIAGEKDAKKHIRKGYEKLKKNGATAKYLELPGARHGEYGPEAQRVMAEGLDWLYK
jgi:predicted esterase